MEDDKIKIMVGQRCPNSGSDIAVGTIFF